MGQSKHGSMSLLHTAETIDLRIYCLSAKEAVYLVSKSANFSYCKPQTIYCKTFQLYGVYNSHLGVQSRHT